MFRIREIAAVFWAVLYAVIVVIALAFLYKEWINARIRAAKMETKAVVAFHQAETQKETGKQGETVATQLKVEVGKSTFKNLTHKRIEKVEKESGLDLGNVSSLTEASVSTVREMKAPLYTDTLNAKNRTPDSFPTKSFKIKTRFGSMSGRITGDSISIRDSITNPLMVLETRPKWKIRHLWPWNWGTRKREVKLLILNPDSRVDTLSNISIVQ